MIKEASHKKGIFKFLSLVLFSCLAICFSSCGKQSYVVHTDPIERDDFVSATITGRLEHVTYYNHHDSWDFRSLKVELVFGEDTYTLSIYDSFISFETDPLEPMDDIRTVTIENCQYTDYKGNKHDIDSQIYYVVIEEYPYADSVEEYVALLVPFFISLVAIGVVIYLSLRKKKVLTNG